MNYLWFFLTEGNLYRKSVNFNLDDYLSSLNDLTYFAVSFVLSGERSFNQPPISHRVPWFRNVDFDVIRIIVNDSLSDDSCFKCQSDVERYLEDFFSTLFR